MANPEHTAMVTCTVALVGEIANNLDIANALYGEKLISSNVLEEMSLDKTNNVKADKIIGCIRNSVQNFPQDVFPKFLDVLKKQGLQRLVEKLESKLGTS